MIAVFDDDTRLFDICLGAALDLPDSRRPRVEERLACKLGLLGRAVRLVLAVIVVVSKRVSLCLHAVKVKAMESLLMMMGAVYAERGRKPQQTRARVSRERIVRGARRVMEGRRLWLR